MNDSKEEEEEEEEEKEVEELGFPYGVDVRVAVESHTPLVFGHRRTWRSRHGRRRGVRLHGIARDIGAATRLAVAGVQTPAIGGERRVASHRKDAPFCSSPEEEIQKSETNK